MARIYENSLTDRGIEKNVDRFADSLKSATYRIDNVDKDLDFLKVERSMDTVSIFIYFDDGVKGVISDIKIIDSEDEIVIEIDDTFTKESHKGFYMIFRYRFEEEVG